MLQRTRQLILAATDGDNRLLPYMFYFYNATRCEEIMLWCLRNNMTGKRLYDLIKLEFKGSILNTMSYILSCIDKGKMNPILAIKDLNL